MIPQLLGIMDKEGYGPFYEEYSCLALSLHSVHIWDSSIYWSDREKKTYNAILITQSTWACSIFFKQDIVNISGHVFLIEKGVGLSLCKQNWIYYKLEKWLINFDFLVITSAAHMRAIPVLTSFMVFVSKLNHWGLQRASFKVNIWLKILNKSIIFFYRQITWSQKILHTQILEKNICLLSSFCLFLRTPILHWVHYSWKAA